MPVASFNGMMALVCSLNLIANVKIIIIIVIIIVVCAASVTGHSAVDATNYNKEFK
jgi:hypothetical protein